MSYITKSANEKCKMFRNKSEAVNIRLVKKGSWETLTDDYYHYDCKVVLTAKETKEASKKRKQELEPLKQMCRDIGYSDGTEKMADCVKDLYLKKMNSQSQSSITTTKRKIDPSVFDDLGKISEDILGGKSTSEAISGSSSPRRTMTCFKTGEETGGLNKICRYDCAGNLVTTTVGSAQVCSIQIQR